MQFKQVKVTWLDAVSEDSWTEIADAKKQECHEQVTFGLLIFENDHRIVIAASFDKANEKVASFYSIPKTWIVKITELQDL